MMRPRMFADSLSVLLIIVAFCLNSVAAQEDSRIRGKVVPAESPNNPPRLWMGIRIKVKNRITKLEMESEQKLTRDHNWFRLVPLNAYVDIIFDKTCYVADGLSNIHVKRGQPEMQTVKLQKTRECLIAEQRQKGQARSIHDFPSDRAGGTSGTNSTASETSASAGVSAVVTAVDTMGDPGWQTNAQGEDLMPSPEVLQKELDHEAATARDWKLFDSFQYNFYIKQEIYREIRPLNELLVSFVNNPQNQDLFKPVSDLDPAAFRDSVRAQFDLPGEVDMENIKRVIKDEALSPSIRGSASVALLSRTLTDQTTKEMIDYFRVQAENPDSEIFATSLVALGRIGEAVDHQKLYNYALNGDEYQRLIAMEALSVAHLIEGSGTFPDAAQTLAGIARKDEDAKVRAAALYALRPFAREHGNLAITTFLSGAKDPNPAVRIEAIWALSVGETEDLPGVRRLLLYVAAKDRSPWVREAAKLSLTGPDRLGNSIRYEAFFGSSHVTP